MCSVVLAKTKEFCSVFHGKIRVSLFVYDPISYLILGITFYYLKRHTPIRHKFVGSSS